MLTPSDVAAYSGSHVDSVMISYFFKNYVKVVPPMKIIHYEVLFEHQSHCTSYLSTKPASSNYQKTYADIDSICIPHTIQVQPRISLASP
jgi:hypothetical protein